MSFCVLLSICSNRMAIGFETPDSERFYGFGERFGDCNQRGHRVGSWLEDGSFSLGVFVPDKWKLRVSIYILVHAIMRDCCFLKLLRSYAPYLSWYYNCVAL